MAGPRRQRRKTIRAAWRTTRGGALVPALLLQGRVDHLPGPVLQGEPPRQRSAGEVLSARLLVLVQEVELLRHQFALFPTSEGVHALE